MRRVKDFTIITGGQIFQAIILIATTRVMTSLLSPAEMGRFSIIYAIMALFIALFISSIGAYIQRRFLEWHVQGQVLYYAKRFLGYLFIASLSISLFILWVKHTGRIFIDISGAWIFVLAFGLLFFEQVNSFFYNGLNLFQKRLWFTLCSNLTLLSTVIISSILVLAFAPKAEFWILGQIFSQILIAGVGARIFFKVVRRDLLPKRENTVRNFSLMRDVFLFAWPLSVA